MAALNYNWQELGRVTIYSSGSVVDTVSIEGRVTAQSTANNTSTFQLRWVNLGSRWRTTSGEVEFTGTYDDSDSCATYPDYIGTDDVFFQIEKTASHNSSGDLTIYVGGSIYAYINSARRSGTISQVAVTLPHIDRFATIAGANDFNDEGNPYMTFTNPGGFRINARLEFGNTSINRDNIANTGSYTFELTNAERDLLRQKCAGKTMVVKYVVATCLSGTTESGWSTLDKTMAIVNADPTLTSYTEEETDTNILSAFGGQPNKIIRYASDLLFTITTSANKYATISTVTVNGVAATYDNGVYKATITNATATDYSIVVTDSRGYLATDTFTSTIVNYIPPNINSNWTVERESQVSSDLVLNATIDAFNEDLDTNITNNVVVQYSMDNQNWVTIPSSSYTYANNEIAITNLTLQNLISYQSAGTFYLKAYDLLRTHQDNKSIPRGIETFSYGESDLQVNGDLIVADTNGENGVNVLDEINIINSNLIFESTNNLPTTQSTANITLWYKDLNKGLYLFVCNLAVNYYGAVGRELYTLLYLNGTEIDSTVGVINSYAYTLYRPIIKFVNVTSDNSRLRLDVRSSTTSNYSVAPSTVQILKLK